MEWGMEQCWYLYRRKIRFEFDWRRGPANPKANCHSSVGRVNRSCGVVMYIKYRLNRLGTVWVGRDLTGHIPSGIQAINHLDRRTPQVITRFARSCIICCYNRWKRRIRDVYRTAKARRQRSNQIAPRRGVENVKNHSVAHTRTPPHYSSSYYAKSRSVNENLWSRRISVPSVEVELCRHVGRSREEKIGIVDTHQV